MKYLEKIFIGLIEFFKHLPDLVILLLKLPMQLWLLIRFIFRHGLRCLRPRPKCRNEIDLPPEVHKRADPMLYSQQWLMSMGLSVTWDNPDIQLFKSHVPVSSELLEMNTDYEVRVRVWNNSYDAPAPGLPVHLIYFGFGAGPAGTYLGKKIIDLGAKATSQCPAFASFKWTTPTTPGHYCLQARLDWPDDANPNNNIGQENTNVGVIHSPARFEFKVKNNASVRRRFIYEVDDYTLPERNPCTEVKNDRSKPKTRLRESRERWDTALTTQGYGKFGTWTAKWKIDVEPEKQIPEANEEIIVKVAIESKVPGFTGRKAFNVNVFGETESEKAPRQFIGGVTLYIQH
ncbi:MAG TPA: hypothetical protein VI603_11465 [Saprospiraceae bacterium]|nr:hypothetical protein [Saprospiraceae bacterium]